MRIRIILSIFAVILLTGGLFPSAFAATGFTDVGTAHPNYEAITQLQNLGVIQGYPDGTFKPEQVVNRVEALKIILGGSGIDVSQAIGAASFSDTSATEWYAKYLKKAVDLNIVQGYPDGTFKPAQTVNLVESLKILLNTNEVDFSATTVSGNPYADAYADQWYSMYVQYAKDNSLIDADAQNRVYPDGGMTRAKLAEAMYRLMQLQGGTEEEPVGEPQSTTLTEEIVMELLDNLSTAETLDEKYQYLSEAKEAQIKNIVTMVLYRDPSDSFYDGFESTDSMDEAKKSLIAAQYLPDVSVREFTVSEINEFFNYDNAVIQINDAFLPDNMAICVGLVYEEGRWKFDSYSQGYLETLENNCISATKMPEKLMDEDLIIAEMNYSSEYQYEVYLNDHLILAGGMQGGIKTMGFPLQDGVNQMHIYVGTSLKEGIMESLDEEDEFWTMLASQINGLQLKLTVDGETLIDEDINKTPLIKYIEFNYSK